MAWGFAVSLVVLVAGTGTEVGKTHVAETLLRGVGARGASALGFKPVETGLSSALVSDASRLDEASTFHVQQSGYLFGPALSPHLAARDSGSPPINLAAIASLVEDLTERSDCLVVELAGGLFTPLTDASTNADLAAMLNADFTVLVAPDRLGVLHDVLATMRAAGTVPVNVDVIVLSCPVASDASTGRNAPELTQWLPHVDVFHLPRGDSDALSRGPHLAPLLHRLFERMRITPR